jgi:hypothetical protein
MPARSTVEGDVVPRKKFLLRIDPKLWEELERWAQDELRSANGQIEFLLKRAVTERRRGQADDDSD